MILPGPKETMQIVNGSRQHPTLRFLAANPSERIALAAPALAFVADLAATAAPEDRLRFESRLQELLDHTVGNPASGLNIPPPRYLLFTVGRNELLLLSRLRAILPEVYPHLIQTIAICRVQEVELLLQDGPDDRKMMEKLSRSGLHVTARWTD